MLNDLSVEGLDLNLTGFDKGEVKELFSDIDVSNFDGLDESLDDEPEKTSPEPAPKTYICPNCGHEFQA